MSIANITANTLFGLTFKQDGQYSVQEWQLREGYYLDLIKAIYIPHVCTTKDVSSISAAIANILAEARWDMMNAKRQKDQWETIMDSEEKIQYNTLKSSSTIKLTIDEVKGMVISDLSNPASPVCQKYLKGNGALTSTVALFDNRFKFIDSIVRILGEKNQTLIIQSSMLKLDSNPFGGQGSSNGYPVLGMED